MIGVQAIKALGAADGLGGLDFRHMVGPATSDPAASALAFAHVQ
jgi:hypothetical protein